MISELKQKIFHTALSLFEKHGFHGVSVKEIVEAVGTSKGGFYHHFSSKDELLFLIHDEFITHALEKANNVRDIADSPTNKLRGIIITFVEVFDIYQAHISVFYQEHIYLPEKYETIIKKKRDQFRDIIIQTIDEGIQTGEFRKELHPIITSMAILGMVNWIYKWYRRGGEKTIEEIAHYYEDLILQAVVQY
ncbi:TetR/AcrR family transcriptional regulator [Cerasibacillus terrae]|uniref:TetR/AcrR family transcriptional regulator n=1 Tax=Cerasibacillus terrae TaxID=2498845 RepID=A0A5C8P2V6_9BACI|nr:TetR/AcrR family transcriptional regulator [Cerasibacillus terrae]TXL67788.1 TetR/AcrR family transcriptional regulator [Cerasibacillus terrae]